MSAYINKAISLCNLGRMDESIKVYDYAWNIDSSNPVLFFNKGNTYKKLGLINFECVRRYVKCIVVL
jgi:hypothetical protein